MIKIFNERQCITKENKTKREKTNTGKQTNNKIQHIYTIRSVNMECYEDAAKRAQTNKQINEYLFCIFYGKHTEFTKTQRKHTRNKRNGGINSRQRVNINIYW